MIGEWLKDVHIVSYLAAAAVTAAAVCLAILIGRALTPLPRRMEARIRRKKYISQEAFLESWRKSKKDYPGCYIILIYDKRFILQPMHYSDIYVGQSVRVRSRVFSHLRGHGNGDVYYGRKSGCRIYVLITRCSRKRLNRAEKELIAYFHATKSLNMTRGGSARR